MQLVMNKISYICRFKDNIPNTLFIFLGFLSVFLAYYFIMSVVLFDYIYSEFMINDDVKNLTRAIAGDPVDNSGNFLLYRLIEMFAHFNSIAIFKVMALVFASFNAGAIFLILWNLSHRVWFSALAAIAVCSFPVSSEQIIFVSASHPLFGMAPALVSFLVFLWAKSKKPLIFVAGCFVSSLFALAAAFLSPNFSLMTLAVVIWVMVAFFQSKNMVRKYLAAIVLPTLVLAGHSLYGIGNYHYSGTNGMVNYSLSTISNNLYESLNMIVGVFSTAPMWNVTIIVSVGIITIYALISEIRMKKWRFSENSVNNIHHDRLNFVLLSMLVCSAFSFAPASITTYLFDRYIVASVIFLGIFLICIFLYIIQGIEKSKSIVFGSSFIILIVINCFILGNLFEQKYKQIFLTQKDLVTFINNEKHIWPDDGQVVFLLREKVRSPSRGYNHWSTLYLRYIAQMPNLSGIIGSRMLIGANPIINPDHSDRKNYWRMVDGRSSRLTMLGIVKSRPLFVYVSDEDGVFREEESVIFISRNEKLMALRGEKPERLDEESFTKYLCSLKRVPFGWGIRDGLPSPLQFYSSVKGGMDWNFQGNQSVKLNLNFNEGEFVRLSFHLLSNDEMPAKGPRNSFPPMPMTADWIAVYQRNESILVNDRMGNQVWNIPDVGKGITLEISGFEGCYKTISANGKLLGAFGALSLSGDWLLGNGSMQRFWNGSISDFRIVVNGKDTTAQHLPQ